jgi:hypothetical protein
MLDDNSNGRTRARSHGTVAKIKITGKLLLVFTCLWFGTHVFIYASNFEKVQDCVMEEERF